MPVHVRRAKAYCRLEKYEAALCECKYVMRRCDELLYNVDIKCIEGGYPAMANYVAMAYSIRTNSCRSPLERMQLCDTAMKAYERMLKTGTDPQLIPDRFTISHVYLMRAVLYLEHHSTEPVPAHVFADLDWFVRSVFSLLSFVRVFLCFFFSL